jgi:nuclear pore complex protein Nup98-Nup96
VRWLEPVDVRGLEIDRVVRIERGVIYVYHEDSGVPSPPPGEGLKKRAEVTLYECRPKKEGEAARAKFEDRILKQTRRMGGELQEYDVKTGVWRFTLQL